MNSRLLAVPAESCLVRASLSQIASRVDVCTSLYLTIGSGLQQVLQGTLLAKHSHAHSRLRHSFDPVWFSACILCFAVDVHYYTIRSGQPCVWAHLGWRQDRMASSPRPTFSPLRHCSRTMSAPPTRTLILMRGLPGSGKTTAANELARQLSPKRYRVFGADDYFVKLGEFSFDAAQAGDAYAVRHDGLATRCIRWRAM